MKRHAEIPTEELIQELIIRKSVKQVMEFNEEGRYKIEANNADGSRYRYMKGQGKSRILVIDGY